MEIEFYEKEVHIHFTAEGLDLHYALSPEEVNLSFQVPGGPRVHTKEGGKLLVRGYFISQVLAPVPEESK